MLTHGDYGPTHQSGGSRRGIGDMELVEGFLANQVMRGLAVTTVDRRRWTLTTFVGEISPRCSAEATTIDVERFISARRTPATRRALLGDLRAFYRWGVSRHHVNVDPTLPVELPKVPKRLATPLTRDELRRAWDAADFRMRCILALGASAGLRVSEMAALDMSNVDLENRILYVRNGKGGKDRAIPMSAVLVDLLRHCGPGPVVSYKTGHSLSEAVRMHFRRVGIHGHRPHDLRHAFATECARVTGGNMLVVAQLMGHTSIATTQRYTAALPVGREIVDGLWREAA